jgi:hypothetical protein
MVYPTRKTHLLRQCFDFMDEDTREPMHDEIMLWLDDAVESIVQNTIVGREWDEAEVRNTYRDHYEAYGDAMPPLPARPPIEILGKTWSWIVRDKSGEPIGCIDLYVQYTRAELLVDREPSGAPRWFQYNDHDSACFEVRTEIASLGELVRQIRLYQAHVHGRFYVVSPDDRFERILQEQEIGFIKYDNSSLEAM